MHSVEGSLTVNVDDFDTEPVHGMEPFRFILARLRLQAQVADLDAVNFLGGPSAVFGSRTGAGSVDMDAAVDHGSHAGEPLLVPEPIIWASEGLRPKYSRRRRARRFSERSSQVRPGGAARLDLARGALRLEERARAAAIARRRRGRRDDERRYHAAVGRRQEVTHASRRRRSPISLAERFAARQESVDGLAEVEVGRAARHRLPANDVSRIDRREPSKTRTAPWANCDGEDPPKLRHRSFDRIAGR